MNIYKPKENVTFKFVESWNGERPQPTIANPFTIETAWSGNIVDENPEYNHEYSGLISCETKPTSIDISGPYAVCGYIRNYHNTSGDDWLAYFDTIEWTSTGIFRPGMTDTYIEKTYTVDGVQYEWPSGSDFSTIPYTGSYGPQVGASDSSEYTFEIETNFPIFDTYEHMRSYLETGSLEGLLNGTAEYEVEETQTYFIYNQYGTGNLLYGSVTPSGSQSWHSMRIKANKTPVLYFTGNGFEMRLSASSVVASKATTGPGYTIDYIPEEDWPENRLDYTGPFYGDVSHYADANGTLPDAGTYTYGFTFSTNCYIFKNQAEAEEAEETGDYEKAVNAYDLDNKYYNPPVVGDPENNTTFGSGAVTSPFVSTYLCSRNDVLNVANAFYSNDASIIDNIKKGLELFGAEPFQALCGLKYFPCSLANIVTAASQNYIYFGSYKHEGVTVDKVVNLNSGGYIDAGTVTLTPVQQSYRSFEPYCGLTVYLPYIGWQKLNIADYFGKTVNIRYYIDIYTGACAAALVANGVLIDYFTGTIGVELPVTGQMLSQYANSALNSILGTAGGTVGGALSGAMMGSAIPGVGTAVGAVAGAAVVGGASLAAGVFKMSQKGTPKDSNHTKGNFTSSIGSYLPQYVIFRFDVHDLIIPDLLTDLYGRPSAASGRVSNFSGFLQADTVKLNTSGMTEEEANEITSLLKEGVFV